ncbi:MAG: major capsid protein [Rhodospirillales bacterium]|nr:major capsid protein [Rhodospirillales bacterium]
MDPMERIAQLLENLSSLSTDELAELRTLVDSTYDEVDKDEAAPTADTIAKMSKLLEALEAHAGEVKVRAEREAADAQRLQEIRDRAEELRNPPEEGVEVPTGEGEGEQPTGEAEGDQPTGEGETPAGDATPEESPLLPEAVAASTTPPAPRGTPAGGMVPRMAQVQRGTPSPEQPSGSAYGATIVAAAGIPRVAPGEEFDSADALAQAMSDKLMRLQTSHDFTSALVASVEWKYPEDRVLGSDADENTRRINRVCGIDAGRYDATGALVATGGICLPVNVDYAVPTWTTADRPLRDALPAFQATRGGVRFVTPPDIGTPSLQGTASGAGTSVGIWTEATDANPAGATKPVWTVACGAEQVVYVNAIPTRVQFGNMESRFAPEQVAANTQQAIAVSAREAELELLTQMYDNSKQVVPAQYLGATRDILASVDLLIEQYVYSHRIPRSAAFTVVFPEWAKGVLRADLARETAHDNSGSINVLAITDAQIEDWFKVRGINVVWTLDGLKAGTYGTGGQAITDQFFPVLGTSGAAPQWPGQTTNGAFILSWLLYVEGTFQFLDGGRLDLGVVRDSLLDATNDYETFVETFEAVAFRGLECYQVHSTILPTGGSTGTVAATSYKE